MHGWSLRLHSCHALTKDSSFPAEKDPLLLHHEHVTIITDHDGAAWCGHIMQNSIRSTHMQNASASLARWISNGIRHYNGLLNTRRPASIQKPESSRTVTYHSIDKKRSPPTDTDISSPAFFSTVECSEYITADFIQ
jgi:hypothetical protein